MSAAAVTSAAAIATTTVTAAVFLAAVYCFCLCYDTNPAGEGSAGVVAAVREDTEQQQQHPNDP